jgi:DNA replication protein DnaC
MRRSRVNEQTQKIDAERLTLILNDLRLPAIKQAWPHIASHADREQWPAARFLARLAEHEIAERDRRRIERHLAEARLPPGKSLDSFAFDAVPMVSKAQIIALCSGDGWLEKGANLILFGPPGGGKSHLATAIGLALVENGWRVLFTRTPISSRSCNLPGVTLPSKAQSENSTSIICSSLMTLPTSPRTRPKPPCSSS